MTKRLLVILPALGIISVAIYFIVTTAPWVRYWVDDFCTSTLLRNSGYFGAQLSWWKSWTGKYSFTAVLDLFELMGVWSVRITSIVILPLLVAALAPVIGLLMASLFVILTIVNSPNITQSLYWQTGSINYTAPFIFLNLFLSFLVFKRRKVRLFIPLILLFVAGGFSEAFALAQGVLLFFALLLILTVNPEEKSQKGKIVIAGMIGAALSIIVMLLSPGNAVRESGVTRPESLVFVIYSTVLSTKWYLLRMLAVKPFVYSLIIIFSSVYIFGKKVVLSRKKAMYVIALAVLAAVFSTMAVIGAGFYSMSVIPPERTLFIAIYMMLLCFIIFSFALKTLLLENLPGQLKNWFLWGVIFVNLTASVFLINSIVLHFGSVRTEIQAYAHEFDKVESKLIANSGQKELTIENIKPVGELDSFTDNKGWVASCLAGFYKIGGIKIAP